MKYTKLLFAAAVSAVLFSCVKEQPESDSTISDGQEINQITATIADADSKTVIDSDGISVLWTPGDEISVMFGSARVKFTAANETPSRETIFTSNVGILFGGGEGSQNYIWAAYPHNETNKLDGNTVTLSVPSIQTSTAGTFAPGTFPTVGRSHTTAITFYNVCGGVCFSLTQPGVQYVTFKGNNNETIAGTVKVQFNDSGVPEVTEVVNGATTIQLNAPTSAGFETGKLYYISILPQTLSTGFTMEFNKTSAKAVKNKTSSVTVKRSIFGKMSNADQGLQYVSTVVDDLSSAGTANCYMVSKSGNYKFKATVKGGSTESVGTPVNAEVLWESFGTDVTPTVGDLVNGVLLDNGYVKFTASDKKGNAVIAVKDASGTILWSWHIWLTDQPVEQVYNNNAGTMMDRNLGATSATPGDVHALGLLYQWGRKDPFLSGDKISNSLSSNQQQASSTLSWPVTVTSTSSTGTIAYAVAHPTTFIGYNSNNCDWYYTGSSSTDNTRWQTTDKSKGIYDPCPKGWRVPDGGSNGVWSKAFGSSSYYFDGPWDSTNRGMNFGSGNGKSSGMQLGSATTIWYPAASCRGDNDGSLASVGYAGDYWSCTPSDISAYNLYSYYYGSVYPSLSYGTRAIGQSVRCIKDESFIPQPEYVDLGLSVKWSKCNIGASKPEEYGTYFAWGDVTGQAWDGSKWSGGGFSTYPTYELDSNNNLKPEYDAAHINLGGTWRMPTYAEQQELINNCTSTWTTINGVNGRLFASKKTGYTDKSIFLPAAGFGEGSSLYSAGSYGGYWSGTFDYYDGAWGLEFYSGGVGTRGYNRYDGQSVRPVSE